MLSQGGFNPPVRVRSDDELREEPRKKLIDVANRPADYYTHAKLIVAGEEVIAAAKQEERFRQAQIAIPYEPEDD